MPFFNKKCPKCNEELKEVLVRKWDDEVKCPKCDTVMENQVSAGKLGGMDRFGSSY